MIFMKLKNLAKLHFFAKIDFQYIKSNAEVCILWFYVQTANYIPSDVMMISHSEEILKVKIPLNKDRHWLICRSLLIKFPPEILIQ